MPVRGEHELPRAPLRHISGNRGDVRVVLPINDHPNEDELSAIVEDEGSSANEEISDIDDDEEIVHPDLITNGGTEDDEDANSEYGEECFVNYWPFVRGCFEAGTICTFKCSICQTRRLRLPVKISKSLRRNNRSTEPIAVLPCGHFYGYPCLDRWLSDKARNISDGDNPDCPTCRKSACHEECGHTIEIQPLCDRKDGKSFLEQVPDLLSDGGHVDKYCRACRYQETRRKAQVFITQTSPHRTIAQEDDNADERRFVQRALVAYMESYSEAEQRVIAW